MPMGGYVSSDNLRHSQAKQNEVIDGRPSMTIAVATHKPYQMPSDPVYLPLHVGAALHQEACKGMRGDDSGDNISDRNRYYSELTGLYWLWKNCDSDYKGLVHYRRHLGSKSFTTRHQPNRFNRIISGEELRSLMEHTDIVVAKKRKYYIETVYSHYAHTFDSTQFDLCREVMLDLHPAYVPAWDELMSSTGAHIFNMFVMKRELFDKYCEWLFPLLFEMEERLDPTQYPPFHARYLGRVSERLLDPWLATNGYDYAELPVISPEPVNWWKKGTGFLMAKFAGKRYNRSF